MKTKLIHKSIGANGPSMSIGVPVMMFGVFSFFIGIGTSEPIAFIVAFLLFFSAIYLILSIDCIALADKGKHLYLYKDYFFTKTGRWIELENYASVCIYFQIDKPKNNRGSLAQTQFKTFTVCLLSNSGDKLVLKEFGDLGIAKKVQKDIACHTELKLIYNPIRETK